METMIKMMEAGYDLELLLTGDKSIYYVYLSHPVYGIEFGYGYGKTLDEAVKMAFGVIIFTETRQEKEL